MLYLIMTTSLVSKYSYWCQILFPSRKDLLLLLDRSWSFLIITAVLRWLDGDILILTWNTVLYSYLFASSLVREKDRRQCSRDYTTPPQLITFNVQSLMLYLYPFSACMSTLLLACSEEKYLIPWCHAAAAAGSIIQNWGSHLMRLYCL